MTDDGNPPWLSVCSCGWSAGPYTIERVAAMVAEGHRVNASQARA